MTFLLGCKFYLVREEGGEGGEGMGEGGWIFGAGE